MAKQTVTNADGTTMKLGKKAQKAYALAQQQADLNAKAAQTQQGTNMVNQVGPNGNLTYTTNPNVKPGDPGYYTATQTLSPAQQAIQAQNDALTKQYNQVAGNQLGNVSQTLSNPLDLGSFDPQAGRGTEIANMQRQFLDPQWAQEQQKNEAWMAERGIVPGTPAYDAQMQRFNDAKARAYTGMAIGADQQAFNQTMAGRTNANNEMLTERNQPLQELSALRSGGQVTQPNFVNTPQAGVANADMLGTYGTMYGTQKQAQAANNGAMWGALGSAGGTAASAAMMSDRRSKTNIKRVGKLNDGTGVYTYRYKGSPLMQMGVMAQEVEKKHPEAVTTLDNGMKGVFYGKIAEAL